MLKDEEQRKELHRHASASLDGLKLDEIQYIGYTYKAFGAGFYGLKRSLKKNFREIITEVIMRAGDADRYVININLHRGTPVVVMVPILITNQV